MARINARRKGKVGELELARRLTECGFPARRAQQYKGTADSADIECEKLYDYLIECKRSQRVAGLYSWLSRAEAEAEAVDKVPVVMHRRNDEDWQATMFLGDWLENEGLIEMLRTEAEDAKMRILDLEAKLKAKETGDDRTPIPAQ